MRQLLQNAPRRRRGGEDFGQQLAAAAADIDDEPGVGEVVGANQRRRLLFAQIDHGAVDDFGGVRVLSDVFEQRLASKVMEGAPASFDAVEHVAPGAPYRVDAHLPDQAAQGAGNIAAQGFTERGVAEPPAFAFVEQASAAQSLQQAVQGIRLRAAGGGKFVDRLFFFD
ncbi:hypothetical protein ABH310_02205 [Chromobacterium piscinae]